MVSENNFLNDDRLGFAAEQYAMLRAGGEGCVRGFQWRSTAYGKVSVRQKDEIQELERG